MSFNQEKEIYRKKIEGDNAVLQEVLNNQLITIDAQDRDELDKMLIKNKNFHRKLVNDEFEIAIVGLEKAGKSTFANALICNDVLPSAPERCTFTATMLKHGNDTAEVHFYTTEEFNDIFVSMLKDIGYPNAQEQSFKTFDLNAFEGYFESLQEKDSNMYKAHTGKTDEEIKDIVNARDRLILDKPVRKFSNEQLSSDEFKEYIKGVKVGEHTDTSKPRSVKKIEIRSSKLEKLTTSIIYDVPGFDSPTKIHERQTLERLKEADAIILISNVGRNPNLVGTQLNILQKNTDEDGIRLSDKLFVFGNQLDLSNNKEESDKNIKTLKNDVLRYKIGNKERVFTGSALKYLIDAGIKSGATFKFEFKNEIDDMHNALIRYYETERFEILKRKINTNQRLLKEILSKIIKDNDIKDLDNLDLQERNKIVIKYIKKIEKQIEDNFKKLKYELKEDIADNKYFTKKFEELLNGEESFFRDITDEYIEEIHIVQGAESSTQEFAPERVNVEIRKELYSEYLDNFLSLISKITDEKAREFKAKIEDTFLNSIVPEDLANSRQDLHDMSKNFIEEITGHISHNNDRFLYLIERFSRDVFDILILHPLGSEDRKSKYEQRKKEFNNLDYFYKNGNKELISLILSGEFKENLVKQLLYDFITRLIESDPIAKTIISIVKNKKDDQKDIFDNISRAKSKEDIKKEIEQDKKNLEDILLNAVIPATNLDLAFYNSIDKQIKTIITKSKEDSGDIVNFVSNIISIVRKTQFDGINQKIKRQQELKETISELKKYL